MRTQGLDKKRLFVAFGILLGICAFGVLYVIIWRFTGIGLPCPIKAITGLECAGCGMTHALAALTRLDLRSALYHNPTVFVTVPYMLWYSVSACLRYARHTKDPLLVPPLWLHTAFLTFLLLFAILRNLSHLF